MNKQLVLTGHARVFNLKELEFILEDTPKCQGDSNNVKCYFSYAECSRDCSKSASVNCATFNYLRQVKSYQDNFGVVKR